MTENKLVNALVMGLSYAFMIGFITGFITWLVAKFVLPVSILNWAGTSAIGLSLWIFGIFFVTGLIGGVLGGLIVQRK